MEGRVARDVEGSVARDVERSVDQDAEGDMSGDMDVDAGRNVQRAGRGLDVNGVRAAGSAP